MRPTCLTRLQLEPLTSGAAPRRLRLAVERAIELLETTRLSLEEIAVRVGYAKPPCCVGCCAGTAGCAPARSAAGFGVRMARPPRTSSGRPLGGDERFRNSAPRQPRGRAPERAVDHRHLRRPRTGPAPRPSSSAPHTPRADPPPIRRRHLAHPWVGDHRPPRSVTVAYLRDFIANRRSLQIGTNDDRLLAQPAEANRSSPS